MCATWTADGPPWPLVYFLRGELTPALRQKEGPTAERDEGMLLGGKRLLYLGFWRLLYLKTKLEV